MTSAWRLLALPILLTACAGGEGTGTAAPDTGPLRCGDLTEACCRDTAPCATGGICRANNTCCAPLTGFCNASAECCDGRPCTDGRCCAGSGSSCSGSECCAGLVCTSGTCAPTTGGCGASGATCCEFDTCEAGLACVGTTCTPCGGRDEMCCATSPECGPGTSCTAGFCRVPTCGNLGQMCCSAAPTCMPPHNCISGVCRPDATCGSEGALCCSGTCNPGLACASGTCRRPVSACAGAATCGECIVGLGLGCGWCADTGTCVSGGPASPTTGSCADWRWTSTSCAPSPVCQNLQETCGAPSECCGSAAGGLSCRPIFTWVWGPTGSDPGNQGRCCREDGRECRDGTDCCGRMDCFRADGTIVRHGDSDRGTCRCRNVAPARPCTQCTCVEDRDCCGASACPGVTSTRDRFCS